MPVTAVSGHAAAVDAAADRMQQGRSAGAQVQLGHAAYGKICAFLPGLIDPVADATVGALGESAAALRETATSLRSAASRADATDRAGAARLRATSRHLELPL